MSIKNQDFPADKKKKQKFFLGFLIAILSVSIVSLFLASRLTDRENEEIPVPVVPAPIVISDIQGIENVYSAAARLDPAGLSSFEGTVKAALMPHHTLIANQLAQKWHDVAGVATHPSVVVIIGAAHENQGSGLVQTTSDDYETQFGQLETADDIVSKIVSDKVVVEDAGSFMDEHSVGVHLPYISKLFPGVPIVPIIAKSNAGEGEARSLIDSLKRNLPENALVIFSIDFSHGLSAEEAFKNDATVLSLMEAKDFQKISLLNETFIDSPFTLQSYLLWLEKNSDAVSELTSDLVWHEHSGNITGNKNEPGTSYLIFFAKPQTPALTITAVGDMMLSRAVGSKLKTVSVETAFSSARDVLDDSDLVFGNLESVFSTSMMESSKEIRFKADPARIDVLQYLGFTQVSVTNNHIGDYGRAAWDESIVYLNAGGVTPVGGYGNDGAPVFTEVENKRVAFLAFDTTIWKMDAVTLGEIISPLNAQADIILVSFHWGNEYQHLPNNQQVELAHAAIDAGADVVIGHHPHFLEGIEKYKDGLILYSLGNFIFDQFGEPENESVVARISWRGEEKNLELIPMRIENYFPRPATEVEKTATLESLASWSDESLSEEIGSGRIKW
ncbi:MAG: AmmeMemoRadiSam system protein B [Candidatus Uhrbacteria bacterium]